ncbi:MULTISPECIES: hypothetical protein [Paenibacillus]|uniref:Uncharacterized protein n=1 Tax=Paenibacillus borealis TaxID=160799 RepID=A0ABX3H3Z4_PAEBO|nr:hypothetical protein [Paenibacillus borealis]OMD43236.1 hypothetical protein BSK56_24370 [Paenibacillus borealis]
MEDSYIQAAAKLSTLLFMIIALIQLLLTFGLPWGEITMGGRYKGKLPGKLRLFSLLSVFILLFFSAVSLQHAGVLASGFSFHFTSIFIWIIAVYLGLNTFANLFSKSPKEKCIMTPLAGIAFLSVLTVAIYA